MSSMGIYDRDYFQKDRRGGNPLVFVTSTAIGSLILVNVLCFIAQVITRVDIFDPGPVTKLLAASPHDVFRGHVYKLLTANFAHSPDTLWHLVWNMLFLYFFGKELEQIYGKRKFLLLYLAAGTLSILTEVAARSIAGEETVRVLGASGAVMAVVVLFTLFYPNHQILFFFFIPAPVWVLCFVYIGGDLYAVIRGDTGGVASFAHLAGAAFALLYRFHEIHGYRYRKLLPRWKRRRARPGPVRHAAAASPARLSHDPAPAGRRIAKGEDGGDAVSRRIDDLLAKISSGGGLEGLTEEEREFLRENSGRYRSS
jgi:membrane associated rhomboid family serine protease